MKAQLLFPDKNFNPRAQLPWNTAALSTDLELQNLLEGMARGDEFIHSISRTAILSGFGSDLKTIRYRQDVLRDCLANPAAIREMYALAVAATEKDKSTGRSSLSRNPDWVLRWATGAIEGFLDTLERLRGIAESHQQSFTSDGLGNLFSMVRSELNSEYCASVRSHLRQLKFSEGVKLGVRLGKGNKGGDHVLLHPPTANETGGQARFEWLTKFLDWFFGRIRDPFSFTLDPQDEGGAVALTALRNQGLALAASALGESAEHVHSFLNMLRTELAFYVGCVNLHEQLAGAGQSVCMPEPAPSEARGFEFENLRDASLALMQRGRVIGNTMRADGKDLLIVTGANQGGKSTFLRSIGLAQLMMQSGMFVTAETFSSSVVDNLSTHFRREEDSGMESGKFDEELGRMSEIVDHVTPNTMILFNESFAATNEREGSEIARQITSALMDHGVRLICVTHLYEFTRSFSEQSEPNVMFLRAERRDDGSRSFKIIEAEPLRTSFGEDLYNEIFSSEPPPPDVANGKHDPARQESMPASDPREEKSRQDKPIPVSPAHTSVPRSGHR
jgi:hypothetical protein